MLLPDCQVAILHDMRSHIVGEVVASAALDPLKLSLHRKDILHKHVTHAILPFNYLGVNK